jgi:spore germination protein
MVFDINQHFLIHTYFILMNKFEVYMEIYIVQPGDTIFSIAEQFNVPYQRLIYDNNISPSYNLSTGQIIIITQPNTTHIVKDGDTVESITTQYGISPIQLMQNNPFLLDRDYLVIGEELIIDYSNQGMPLEVNAFVFSYVDLDTLQHALPYLTYLTIADYRLDDQGNLLIPEDSAIIDMVKNFGVAPLMMLSGLTTQGEGSFGITHKVFNRTDQQNSLIDNLLYTLREKGLSGVNFAFQNILPEDLPGYVDLIRRTYERLKPEGFYIFVTLIPNTFGFRPENDNSQNPYYEQIGQIVDAAILQSFQFTNAYLYDVEQTTVPFLRSYAEFMVTQIPPEKIMLGYTRIAYDWELPYVEGQSRVSSVTNSNAIQSAGDLGIPMGFDEYHQTPYYYYERGGIQHFVWFKDARTINAAISIIEEYHLKGISIWNAMDFAPQIWVALNSQHEISKRLNVTSEFL